MSSKISFVPIIPSKTKEQIINEYYMDIERVRHQNANLEIQRSLIIDILDSLSKKVISIGRKEKKVIAEEKNIEKVCVVSGLNTNKQENIIIEEKTQRGAPWLFSRNVKDEMHRIENKLKTIPFCTIKEATEARAIISLIKKNEDNTVIVERYKRLMEGLETMSEKEHKLLFEYTSGKVLIGEDNIYSYEEAVDGIEELRQAVNEKLINDYKQNVFREACEKVNLNMKEIICNGKVSYETNEIDGCEMEVNEFEDGEMLIESVGIIDTNEGISISQKRQCVNNTKRMCEKINELYKYIAENYPDIKMNIGNIREPDEDNIRIKYSEDKNKQHESSNKYKMIQE